MDTASKFTVQYSYEDKSVSSKDTATTAGFNRIYKTLCLRVTAGFPWL
jgi:prolyl-tRNA editing enzyme YbaK/EbsC (Cys-tRNA(Pro) deacylase)